MIADVCQELFLTDIRDHGKQFLGALLPLLVGRGRHSGQVGPGASGSGQGRDGP
jgi:hypothetical protein